MTATAHTGEVCPAKNKVGIIIQLAGDISVRNAAVVTEALIAAWEVRQRPPRVTLDLSNVRHLDSSGVGALMEVRHRLESADARLVLRNLTEGPRRLLERTGILRLFDLGEQAPVTEISPSRGAAATPLAAPKGPRHAARMLLCVAMTYAAAAGGAAAHHRLNQFKSALNQSIAAREANAKARLDAVENAARATDARIDELQQESEQISSSKERN